MSRDQIKNISVLSSQIVLPQIRIYSTTLEKARGLMFLLRAPDFAVLFPFSKPRRVGIHMFFVFFPLDIVWLDKNGVIQEIKTLKPFTLHTPNVFSSYVFELPAKWCMKNNLKKGMKVPESYLSAR